MKKIMLFVLTLLIGLTGFISAEAGSDNFAHHGVMGYGFMWVFMILILVALVLFIVWLIKQIQGPKRRRK